MSKKYTISTIAELQEAYDETENKEDLLIDLEKYLAVVSMAHSVTGLLGEKADAGPLNWIDDGAHDATVNVTVKDAV
jgi:hypothetical protein